jgi:glycosyltransferase involved in cell wall biosynthesis
MNDPLVSIIVPCYNQAQYLSEALLSVLDQTYNEWECIIVNDGSPDNTEAVAQEWLEKDTRFKYFYKENGGLSSARNAGITIAKGEFILPLDADDRIGPNYLSLAVNEFKKDAELKVVYCKAEKFGDEVGEWKLPEFSLKRLVRTNMIFCSAIYKKSDWKLVEGYDINLLYGLEDWEFWIALLKNNGKVKRIELNCFFYRIKKDSMAQVINDEQSQLSEKYVLSKHSKFFFDNYDKLFKAQVNIMVNLSSEKFVINLFTEMFFKIKFFK